MKPLLQEFPDSKAGDILAVAERLFSRHGYDGISMNAVAQEAGVSKANVFHHFGSKEELYMAVLQHVRRELMRDVTNLASESGGDLGHALFRVGQLYLDHFLANADRVRLCMRENLEERPGQGRVLAERVFGQDHAALLKLLTKAQASGELRADINPTVLAALLMAACVFYFQSQTIIKHLPGTEELDDPRFFIQKVVDILLHGVATTEHEPAIKESPCAV